MLQLGATPAVLGGGLVQQLGPGGVLTVEPDAGLVYKFAGYLCLEAFNFLQQVARIQVFRLMYLVSKLPQSPELSYSIGLNLTLLEKTEQLEQD